MHTQNLWWGYKIRPDSMVLNPQNQILRQHLDAEGYFAVNMTDPYGTQHHYRVHRLVARKFVHNPAPSVFTVVDHVDRNKRLNDISNLRWLSQKLNCINNDCKGVFFNKKWRKWIAKFRNKYIGAHKTYQGAHKMYVAMKKKTFEKEYVAALQTCENTTENLPTSSLVISANSPILCV